MAHSELVRKHQSATSSTTEAQAYQRFIALR